MEKRCEVEECERPVLARMMCFKHYARWRKYGTSSLPTPEERFWSKVDKDGPLPAHRPELGPCWLWTGGQNAHPSGNYGRAWDRAKKVYVYAHRVAYEALAGPIPDGLDLDHLCRVRLCVNPLHLEPVTRQVNLLRGHAARRSAS